MPFASFLCLLEACARADNKHRCTVFHKVQNEINLKGENILRVYVFSSDWEEAVIILGAQGNATKSSVLPEAPFLHLT